MDKTRENDINPKWKNLSREELARELCANGGADFDKLSEKMQGAWLHNADTELKRKPVDELDQPIADTRCPVCLDTGIVDGKFCHECNRTGNRSDIPQATLPAKEPEEPAALTEENLRDALETGGPPLMTMEQLKALSEDTYIPDEAINSIELEGEGSEKIDVFDIEEAGDDNDTDTGTDGNDPPAGSPAPSKPEQSKKQKKKAKARKKPA